MNCLDQFSYINNATDFYYKEGWGWGGCMKTLGPPGRSSKLELGVRRHGHHLGHKMDAMSQENMWKGAAGICGMIFYDPSLGWLAYSEDGGFIAKKEEKKKNVAKGRVKASCSAICVPFCANQHAFFKIYDKCINTWCHFSDLKKRIFHSTFNFLRAPSWI